jgi:CTP-dependent riboflavin kinase
VIGHDDLGAGIAAVDVNHRPIAPQQIAAVDQTFQIRKLSELVVIPEMTWHIQLSFIAFVDLRSTLKNHADK